LFNIFFKAKSFFSKQDIPSKFQRASKGLTSDSNKLGILNPSVQQDLMGPPPRNNGYHYF